MNIFSELNEIGKILKEASTLMIVRQEVGRVMKSDFFVTDGKHYEGAENFEVVVRCGSEEDLISRRLRDNMPNFEITRIAEGIIGVRSK